MELISNEFSNNFKTHIKNRFQTFLNRLFPDESSESVKELYKNFLSNVMTPKHRLLFMCNILGIEAKDNILEFVNIRNQISAHASLEEITIPIEEFQSISNIASETIVKYLGYL